MAFFNQLYFNKLYYLNFNEPETNTRPDLVFGYQLDGEWITDWHGLPGVFLLVVRVPVLVKRLQLDMEIYHGGSQQPSSTSST